jgi:protocadherin Fat 1/2/3
MHAGQIQFNSSDYSTSVYENIAIGTELDLYILAVDLESDNVSSVEYSIIAGIGITDFSINSTTGVISTAESIDYEVHAQQLYQFTIQASTSTNATSTDTAFVTITVLDVNDNRPVLSSNSVGIPENSLLGTIISTIRATDADSGINAQLSYSITSGNDQEVFNLNSTQGTLSVAGDLDRETTASYNLTVQAMDGGSPPLTSSTFVTITIGDVNDNPPVFSKKSYTATLPYEELDVWSTMVTATDQDSGSNAAITYSITDGDAAEIFTIDKDGGNISVSGMLDPEEHSSFSLTVQAMDGENTAQAVVVIIVDTGSSATSTAATVTILMTSDGPNGASRHSAKLLLYPLLSSLALLVSAILGI